MCFIKYNTEKALIGKHLTTNRPDLRNDGLVNWCPITKDHLSQVIAL